MGVRFVGYRGRGQASTSLHHAASRCSGRAWLRQRLCCAALLPAGIFGYAHRTALARQWRSVLARSRVRRGHKARRVRFNPVWQGGVGRGVRKCRLLRGSRSARGTRVSPSSPSALFGSSLLPPRSVLTEQERGKDNPAPDEYFYDYPRICFHADAAWHAQVVHGVRVLPGR